MNKDDMPINDEALEQEESQEQQSGQSDSLQEQLVRISADFANYKRRVEKDRTSWITTSKISVIETFLPIIDELDLAISQSEKQELSDDMQQWFDGFVLVKKNLQKRLHDLGVEQIDCSGSFDPAFHEALLQVSSDDKESGQIVAVLTPGYKLGDTVIRHAKVSVAQ